jgi:hypothetical protein
VPKQCKTVFQVSCRKKIIKQRRLPYLFNKMEVSLLDSSEQKAKSSLLDTTKQYAPAHANVCDGSGSRLWRELEVLRIPRESSE